VVAIDTEDRNGLLFVEKGGQTDASVLYEMPQKEGNKESQGRHAEEQETGDAGRVSGMRDQAFQDWKGIRIAALDINKGRVSAWYLAFIICCVIGKIRAFTA
jgi:hypothetical protein